MRFCVKGTILRVIMDASTSQARWELENNVENTDEYLKWDEDAASAVVRQAPWKSDPKHYKK